MAADTGSALELADWPILLNQFTPGLVKDKIRPRVSKKKTSD